MTPTPRESEVLALRNEGRTAQQIAALLGMKEGTVKQHTKNLFQKGLAGKRPRVAKWDHAKLDALLERISGYSADDEMTSRWELELRACKS